MATHNVLYLTSELYPFAKVGGLADVAGALPKFLKELDHDVRVFLPKYKIIRDRKYNLREVIRLRDIEVPLGEKTITVSVKSGFVPDSKVQAYFLEYKPFFDRKDIYVDPKTGQGWSDDCIRFALFARAALETLKVLYWQPDLIHVNDWPSALAPYYLKNDYANDEFFEKTRSVLTIHNVGYQGIFGEECAPKIFGEENSFDKNHPAWHGGKINFLKAGIESADTVTTVSPSYAKEIVKAPGGAGLEAVLAKKKRKLVGLLNGIDTDVWNPEKDKHIAANYSAEDPADKAKCRADLCETMGLECEDDKMVIGMIGRLVDQKGFDLVVKAAEKLLKGGSVLAILGTGAKEIEEALTELADKHKGRIAVNIGFDETLAHKITAGSDIFLMPSKYEPCGLNQMYSLHYGTVPVVHATGGLADTVKEFKKGGKGNGFLFEKLTQKDMVAAVDRARKLFTDENQWEKVVANAMEADHSWDSSAKKLVEVYGKTSK